jgi:hypothetical protein
MVVVADEGQGVEAKIP